MTQLLRFITVALVLAASACHSSSQSESSGSVGSAPMQGKSARAPDGDAALGAMLAYEHTAEFALEAQAIPARLRAARTACEAARFGACVVLNVQQTGGDQPSASLGLRIAPLGVEPMIALASTGAILGSRTTRAEDLAVVVRDNRTAQERFRKELARLQEFQQRRDLAVADMIALSKQLSETEAQLQAAEQEGGQHRRRIDTQLLTLNFQPPGGQAGRNEITQALRDFGKTLSMGAAWTIRAAAFLIPMSVLLLLLVAGLKRWRRRRG